MILRTDFCIEALAQLGAQRQEVVGSVMSTVKHPTLTFFF